MPSFTLTTRVVLHKDDARTKEHSPDAEEYETLHSEMHRRGYRRFFETDDKRKVKLPPGEYTIKLDAEDGAGARGKAMAKAKAAATIATSEKRFSAYVTGGNGLRSCHLEEIDGDPDV